MIISYLEPLLIKLDLLPMGIDIFSAQNIVQDVRTNESILND